MKIFPLILILLELVIVDCRVFLDELPYCPWNCTSDEYTQIMKIIVNLDMNCLNSDSLYLAKKCMCKKFTGQCLGDKFHECLNLPHPSGGTTCRNDCDTQMVVESLAFARRFRFNCVPVGLLNRIRNCFCENGTDECPGSGYKECLLT